MARLSGQITLVYHLYVLCTFFATPFFGNIAAPVVFVSARELHREQALARAQQRWDQRISHPENSNIDSELPLLGPFDPDFSWPLSPNPTLRESQRFASPSQTSVPSRTKSAPLSRITSSPGDYDLSLLHRRYIEKRAVCPIVIQTTVYLFFASGEQVPYATSTVAGPRSTGIPGDNISRLLNTFSFSDVAPNPFQTANTTNGGNNGGSGGPGASAALLAGIFSILALIVIAFVLTTWYHCRNRKARKLAAAGQIEERKDAPTIVREMGSKGFTTLGSSPPPGQNRALFHPGNMIDKVFAPWGRPKDAEVPRHSKASADSELQEWNMNSERIPRSVRWNEPPPGSVQRDSDFTGARSDEVYPTMARGWLGTVHDVPNPVPASLSFDFQFPNQRTSALSEPEPSHSPPAANTAFTIPRVPVRYATDVLNITNHDVLYETGPSRSESAASSYAVPPTRALPIGEQLVSHPRSNFTGATAASRSISPRRATTTTAATSVSPTFFKRTSDILHSPPSSVSPPLRDSREGESNSTALMAGFGLIPAGPLEARTVGAAGQEAGTSSGAGEDLFATSDYRGGNTSNTLPGPSGPSIPFPRESVQVLPVRRPPGRDEMMSREHQMREKERKLMSRRIVQLAMASPAALVSLESFSTDSQGMPDMYEGAASGSHPPVSTRPEHFRKDSVAETHQRQFSTKSYPYAGLIALHAPTARPLSVSSKAKSPISLGHLSLSAETDYGKPFGAHSKQTSRVASFSSSQYLYGYSAANLDGESVRGRSLSSRRSSMSALSGDLPTSPGRQRKPSLGPSGRVGARASFGPTNKAEAAQRAAALIQLTSGARRDRQAPTRSPTLPL